MKTSNCACLPCNAQPFDAVLTQSFWSAPKPEINMASSVTSLSSESAVEGQAVNFALQVIGIENITIKEKQMQILRIKDALAVLSTGFGKSLIYQLIAPFADFMDSGFRSTETNSIVLVVSPLNPLIRDQVTKLRECGLRACILKGDHVAGSRSFSIEGCFDRN